MSATEPNLLQLEARRARVRSLAERLFVAMLDREEHHFKQGGGEGEGECVLIIDQNVSRDPDMLAETAHDAIDAAETFERAWEDKAP